MEVGTFIIGVFLGLTAGLIYTQIMFTKMKQSLLQKNASDSNDPDTYWWRKGRSNPYDFEPDSKE